jgi:hypothetical protein
MVEVLQKTVNVSNCIIIGHVYSTKGSFISCRIFDVCGSMEKGEDGWRTARAKHPPRSYHGENPEIGNLSIFIILTSNLVSKVLHSFKWNSIFNQQAQK